LTDHIGAHRRIARRQPVGARIVGLLASTVLMATLVGCEHTGEVPAQPAVQKGAQMTIAYSMHLADAAGEEGRRAQLDAGSMTFRFGADEIFPALEAALASMSVGERATVTLTAEDAYGPRDEGAVREVDIDLVPPDARSVGAELLAEDDQGNRREAVILSIDETTAVVDMNHPLAGRALAFDVEVVSIAPADSVR